MASPSPSSSSSARVTPEPAPGLPVPETDLRYQYRAGEAELPTIVFCNGLGLTLDLWYPITDRLPRFATFVYDRPDDDSDAVADPVHQVAELAALTSDLPGDLVVVGHSYGGLLAEAFAHFHPERVRALVLVDASRPADYTAKHRPRTPRWRLALAAVLDTIPKAASRWAVEAAARTSTARAQAPAVLAELPPDVTERMTRPEHIRRTMREDHSLPLLADLVRTCRAKGPLDIPTTVVAATLGQGPRHRPLPDWTSKQVAQLPELSMQTHYIALTAAHLVMIDAPDELAGIIGEAATTPAAEGGTAASGT